MNTELQNSVANQLEFTAQKYPDRLAYSFPEEKVKYTFSQTVEQMDKVAKALLASDIKKGDPIAIWSTNCSQFVLLVLGAAKIGAPIVCINSHYMAKEVEYLLKKSRSKMLFSMSVHSNKSISEQLQAVHCLSELQVINLSSKHPLLPYPNWEDFLSRGKKIADEELIAAAKQVSDKDVYSIQFTSGTTALPKGAILRQGPVLRTTQAYAECLHLTEKDITGIPLPLFHVFGNVLTLLSPVVVGACSVYQSGFSVEPLLNLLAKEKCTLVTGVPTMYLAMIHHPNFPKYDLSHLTKGAMGGAYCLPAAAEEIEREMKITLCIGFGMSECASLCAFSDLDAPMEQRLHSVGNPLKDVEIMVKDPAEDGHGEMLVRGYCVMEGYYDSPQETAKALDQDGWLHTGDVCMLDEKGAVHVTGRLKDIIIRGGENITPSEIEEVLLFMEVVRDVRCVGVRDKILGEEIAAFIIPEEGKMVSPDEVRQYVKDRMAPYKVPRYVFVIEAFPINGAGKVLNSKLRELAESMVGAQANA